MKTTLQILKGTRELLSDPDHWTVRADARLADGEPASPDHPDAVCWCLYGALRKASASGPGWGEFTDAYSVVTDAAQELGFSSLEGFNDSQDSVEAVQSLLDGVIYEQE